MGGGTPSSARLHPASRAARSGALAAGTLRDPLWGDCWSVVLGAELEQAPQCTHGPRTSPQACLVCPAGRVRTHLGPSPIPLARPRLSARQSSSGLLRGHGCTASASPSGGSGSGPHWPQLGLLLPGLAQHLSLPRDPAGARARPRHQPHVATPSQLLCKLNF